MSEQNITNAVRCIDIELEEWFNGGYYFFSTMLTLAEREEVIRRVISNKWVDSLDAYESINPDGIEGILFVFDKKKLKEIKRDYKIN